MIEVLVRKDDVVAEWVSLSDLRNMLRMLDLQEAEKQKRLQALEFEPAVSPV